MHEADHRHFVWLPMLTLSLLETFFHFKASLTSLSAEFLPATDDDVMSNHSDFSEASEMVSSVLCCCVLATCKFIIIGIMRYYVANFGTSCSQ